MYLSSRASAPARKRRAPVTHRHAGLAGVKRGARSAMRRSSALLPAAVLVAGAWLLVSLWSEPAQSQTFLTGSPAAGTRAGGRVAVRGFKDDFLAWKNSLTPEEQDLVPVSYTHLTLPKILRG